MRIVIFKNPNAIFDFFLPDVIDCLKYYSDQNVHEAAKIMDEISSSPLKAIKVETDYFGYIVLRLIKAGKGHAYCKICKKMYDSNQLTSRPLGFGKSPFEVNLKQEGGIIKRFFGKKNQKLRNLRFSGRGGEAYDCPNGHELIAMITWVT